MTQRKSGISEVVPATRSHRILVVDDDPRNRNLISKVLKEDHFDVWTAENGGTAVELMEEEAFEIILTDLVMPRVDGLELLDHVRAHSPRTQVIVITGFGTIKTAVAAMRAGAYDYITKPFSIDELRLIIERALEHSRLSSENFYLKRQLRSKYRFDNFVGDSEPIQKVVRMIEMVADSDSTILIQGESGTGKEVVAKAIHYNSPRGEQPFVTVNCGALPESLMESELFGYERGAFTGATSPKPGRFELAEGGTVFLDEVGDMPPVLQIKLLRVLQEHTFERLGGTKTHKLNVRVIAATHRNLEKAVEEGKFREDLFYRLNVIPLLLPPLRERKEDIPLLVEHFLEGFRKSRKKGIGGVEEVVVECLLRYHWPGNIRELENLIDRMVVLDRDGVIAMDDLPEKFWGTPPASGSAEKDPASVPGFGPNLGPSFGKLSPGVSFETAVSEFEKRLILNALEQTGWVKNKAAKLLNMKRTTLVEKMKKIQLERPSHLGGN
ncbi:MAG: sigma-54-dependent Fis family transcriptional regulator [Candidatus Tectomicrobia bacterium]|nr:sigma-54-dependent Fis family transcriptional regulator [Candidatus Tectomicrobia bacterium]